MKLLLMITCFITLGVLNASAQAGKSTKYVLFPDFDKDFQKFKTTDNSNARMAAPAPAKSPREMIFTNYQPQTNAPKTSVPKVPRPQSAKLSSEDKAPELQETLKAREEMTKKPELPLQGGTEPKETIKKTTETPVKQ